MSMLQNIPKFIDKKLAQQGRSFDVHRPVYALNPLAGSLGATLAYPYRNPKGHGDSDWFLMIGTQLARVGDYLVRDDETYFYARAPQLMPAQATRCNRRVALIRMPTKGGAVGAQGYGGACTSESVTVLGDIDSNGCLVSGWPASVLHGGRQIRGTDLPMAVSNAGFQILLPPTVPVTIDASDILVDDLGRRYQAEGCELTDMGWRINAKEVHI